jgi:hypothetical protein
VRPTVDIDLLHAEGHEATPTGGPFKEKEAFVPLHQERISAERMENGWSRF